jgi:hypothetical protein
MKVNELIKELLKYNPKFEVGINAENNMGMKIVDVLSPEEADEPKTVVIFVKL